MPVITLYGDSNAPTISVGDTTISVSSPDLISPSSTNGGTAISLAADPNGGGATLTITDTVDSVVTSGSLTQVAANFLYQNPQITLVINGITFTANGQ